MPTIHEERIVDPVLTNFALAYTQENAQNAHDLLFPEFKTDGESGTYYVYDANMSFRRYDSKRADGAEARAIDFVPTKDTFSQEAYALKSFLTDRQRRNALNPFRLEQGRVRIVTEALEQDREVMARNMIFPVGFTPEKTTSPLWNVNGAKVLTDVVTSFQSIIKGNGVEANVLLIPPRIWAIFMDASVTDSVGWVMHERLKYVMATTGNNITPQLVMQLFGMSGRIIVPNRIMTNTPLTNLPATVGAGITSGYFIWDKYSDETTDATCIVFAHVDPNADEMGLTLGWTFQSQGLEITRYREPQLDKEWYQGGRVEVRKIVAASCLYRVKVI